MTEQSVIKKVLTKVAKSRTESPEIRRRQILDATRKLLSLKGYQDIKLDDVASKAQLAKGTLYLHFKDKEQIVRAVFEDLMDQQEAGLSKIEETHDIEQLKRIALFKLQFIHENHDFFSQFMHLKDTLNSSNRDGVQKRFQKHVNSMMGLMKVLMKKGEIRTGDLFLTSFYFMSLIRMFWIKDQIFGKENKKATKTLEIEVDALMNLFLNGIQGAQKGKKS